MFKISFASKERVNSKNSISVKMKRFFNLQMNRQVKTFLHMFKFYFVGKNNNEK